MDFVMSAFMCSNRTFKLNCYGFNDFSKTVLIQYQYEKCCVLNIILGKAGADITIPLGAQFFLHTIYMYQFNLISQCDNLVSIKFKAIA